nr:hypothetical protein [Tanacetum cinerariifolium]
DEENVFNHGRKSVDIDEGIELLDDQEKDAQVKGRQADTQADIYNIDLDHTSKVLSMQEDSEVIPAAEPVVGAVSIPISAAKPKGLKAIHAAPTVSIKKRKEVVIRDPKEELHDDTPAETQSAKDKGKGIFVEDPKPMKKKDQIAMDAEYARKLQEEEESLAQAKDAQATDSKEEMEKEEEEIIKSINETPAQKAAKRRRLREQAKEAKDHKKQLREDLEDLWKIVKTRFSTSKPTNWTDDYLLATLKNTFGKTEAQDVLWKSQQTEHGQALVKSWKLLTSCGVHIITFT